MGGSFSTASPTTTSDSQYEFPTLEGPRSIRLLHVVALDPRSVENDNVDSMALEIKSFPLDECPEFAALSYTWGSATFDTVDQAENDAVDPRNARLITWNTAVLVDDDTGYIDINCTPINHQETVTRHLLAENLSEALIQLWKQSFTDDWLWVDALCIDQNNDEEKQTQVALMGEIYSQAIRVIVWLGSDKTDLQDFLWLHRDFLYAILLYLDRHGLDHLKSQNPYDIQFLGQLNVSPPSGRWVLTWESYFNFCRRRRWFNRAWVVQEVTLARDIMVQCGSESISWERLSVLSRVLRTLRWGNVIGPKLVGANFSRALGDEITRLWVIRDKLLGEIDDVGNDSLPDRLTEQDKRKEWFHYFQILLLDTRLYSALDPRDKLFSILGIAKKTLPLGLDMPLHPDYSKTSTPQSVFTVVAAMLLKEVPRLRNLCHVEDHGSTRVKNLPSWVPDYTVRLSPTPLDLVRYPPHTFDCWPIDNAGAAIEIAGCSLYLKGHLFDRISAICIPMWDVVAKNLLAPCLEISKHLHPDYLIDHDGPVEVLWRTLIANTFKGEPASAELGLSFKDWLVVRLALTQWDANHENGEGISISFDEGRVHKQFECLPLIGIGKDNRGELCQPTIRNLIEIYRLISQIKSADIGSRLLTEEERIVNLNGNSQKYLAALGPCIPYRRLYRTERGYLGLGPVSLEVGDQVWAPVGAMVPVVLREQGDATFSLVGETYLHGFMDGQIKQRASYEIASIVIK